MKKIYTMYTLQDTNMKLKANFLGAFIDVIRPKDFGYFGYFGYFGRFGKFGLKGQILGKKWKKSTFTNTSPANDIKPKWGYYMVIAYSVAQL